MKYKYWLVITIYILIININQLINIKWDITKDKRFSIKNSSYSVLKQLDTLVNIQVFLTGNLPSEYRKLSTSCKEILTIFKQINPQKIKITFLDINELANDSLKQQFYDSLYYLGANFDQFEKQTSSQKITQIIVPCALISYKNYPPVIINLKSSRVIYKLVDVLNDIQIIDKEATTNEAIALLENKFIQAIYALSRPEVPIIGLVIGNNEAEYEKIYDLIEKTKTYYQLALIDLNVGFPDPKRLNCLLIIKPKAQFSEAEKYKLDQYIMHGGNIIWAIDILDTELDYLKNSKGSYLAYTRNLNLEDMFFNYGIRINPTLIQDLTCAKIPIVLGHLENGQPNIQSLPWPYFPLAINNNQHPISQNIDKILTQFPSSIDTIKSKNLVKTILLSTDSTSRAIYSPTLVSLNSLSSQKDLLRFNQHYYSLAVLVEGNFKSLYAQRPNPILNDSIKKYTNMNFVAEGVLPAKQLFISDADILTNGVTSKNQPLPMGVLEHDNYPYANANFYLNVLDYFLSEIPIYESRNKSYILRTLDKVKIEKNKFFWQTVFIIVPLLFFILLNIVVRGCIKYYYTCSKAVNSTKR